MQIDFNSDKIIWVSYAPGGSGHSVTRLISLSPDVYWNDAEQDDPEFNTTGRAHFDTMVPFAYTGKRDPSHIKLWMMQNNNFKDINTDLKICSPIHINTNQLGYVFPNAKIVAIRTSDHKETMRAIYEKVPDLLFAIDDNKKECIRKSRARAIDRRNALDNNKDINILVIEKDKLFSRTGWDTEYLKICEFVGIKPMLDKASLFIVDYIDKQWNRKII